jgi:phosphoglycerate dehydrogenase-like enzyme
MTKPIIAITIGQAHYARMFDAAAWRRTGQLCRRDPPSRPRSRRTKPRCSRCCPRADACITSWDVAPLDADVLAAAPKLRAMAHMGGSVKRFVSDAVWAARHAGDQRRARPGARRGRDHRSA